MIEHMPYLSGITKSLSCTAFSEIYYYSDEEIFCRDAVEREHTLAHIVKPLLTIDKDW